MGAYPFSVGVSDALKAHNGVDGFDHGKRSQSSELQNCRGRLPSIQAARLRTMLLESWKDPSQILATCCADDALSARLIEEAGFPLIFLGGYAVSASLGLPDTELANRIQEVSRRVNIPIFVDGDTGYGSSPNVRRTVEGFARAGAAGVMIEDQTWPKKCGHTKGKSVVSREEAFARVQAAVDARNEGTDIVILARTDSLILGWDEALLRATTFAKMGADMVFIEALPDRLAMEKAAKEAGFAMVAYPFTIVAAKIKAVREALEGMKGSMTVGAPPQILSAAEVCEAVGFEDYWKLEERYKY
ncbi:hypothetical protein AYO22_11035 [Fonsecaea multimorphosa]|nr:hypothetical protein AYO22_11035 [Fonsecaea multimorphosa]